MTTYTAPLTSDQAETLRRGPENQGFDFETKAHAIFAALIRATPGCSHVMVSIGPERYNQMHASFGP